MARRRSIAVTCVLALVACGEEGVDEGSGTIVEGLAWMGGPIEGAEVVVYQLVSATGVRGSERGRGRTDAEGRFRIALGATLNTIELDAIGGTYVDVAGGARVARGEAVVRGVAFDLGLGEVRGGVVVSPWSHLAVAIGDSRGDDVEGGRLGAMREGHALVAAHLGFDPVAEAIASLDAVAPSPTPPVRHALALAGLAMMGVLANADGHADVTAERFAAALAADVASEERLLDGDGGARTVTAVCGDGPIDGCDVARSACEPTCRLTPHTLRAAFAQAIRAYLIAHPATGQTAATLATWLEELRTADEPRLFPPGAPEPFDARGPRITWVAPEEGATVGGAIAVEVRAADPIGVASIRVEIEGAGAREVVDVDPAPDRFRGTLDSTAPPLPEGAVRLRAVAIDADGNATSASRAATVDNLMTGSVSGVVVKGRVAGAAVAVHAYAGGVRGELLGSGTTDADGAFVNVAIREGYGGPLLVEAGGAGAYAEDAAPAGTPLATLDAGDHLRAVVPVYTDGGAIASVVVSPLSTFAVTYAAYLGGLAQPAPFATRWQTATEVIGAQMGVADFATRAPSSPETISGIGDADRFGLVLVGLSQLAYRASTQGGGDAGSYATAMDSMRVVATIDRDLADGCLDGRAGAMPLVYGGTQRPGDQTLRLDLAGAIAAWIRDGARNPTALTVADVLPLLDALASGGPQTGPGACPGGGLFETPGGPYDRASPAIVWQPPTPEEGAWVRDTITVRATAVDEIDLAPALSWLGGLVDSDGDPGNAVATAAIDTAAIGDGPLTIAARAVDDSGNAGSEPPRIVQVDNTDPILTISAAGFYASPAGELWTASPAPTLTGTVTEAHLASVRLYRGATELVAADVVGSTWAAGIPAGTVPDAAPVVLRIEAIDRAGNVASVTRALRHDRTAPVLAFTPTTIRDEAADAIAFATTPDPAIGNVPGFDPTHDHGAAPLVALGATPAPACTPIAAPTVTKHAYLLDEAAPPYVRETGGAGAAGRNPLAFAFRLTDDGVGLDLAATRYRVRDATTDTTVLDWQPLADGVPILDPSGAPIGRAHTIAMHRIGTTTPSIPALHTAGLYAIDLAGRDLLGRAVADTRCWNLRLLPAPIYVGPPSETRQVAGAPSAPDRYGFTFFSLGPVMSLPPSPVGRHLLDDDVPGVGLIEFSIWNPTSEAVHVALDLTRPGVVRYSKEVYDGYWGKASEAFADVDCGFLAGPPASPNYNLPGCARYTGFPAATVTTTPPAAASPAFTIRVFEELVNATAVELSPCLACAITSVPAAGAGELRVVVLLPPRAAPNARPRKFWIMPSVRTIAELRPGGAPPYTEHATGTQVLTGTYDASQTLCATFVFDSGSGRYRCTRRATYRRYKVTTRASFSIADDVETAIRVSRDGATFLAPSYLQAHGMTMRAAAFAAWSTAESMLPLPPTTP